MNNKVLIPFIIMCLIQLYVPASMIFQNEATIAQGEVFKFKTVPVDPNDPFRGKFIRLSFDANEVKLSKPPTQLKETSDIFVVLDNNIFGFAKITSAVFVPPTDNQAYIRIEGGRWYRKGGEDSTSIVIEYPFDRFYLEESKAPEAERLYFEALRDSQLTTYAQVFVHEGRATLKEVFVDEVPIADWVAENQEE